MHMRTSRTFLTASLLLTLSGLSIGHSIPPSGTAKRRSAASARPAWAYAHLPLSFERNEGQTDAQVKFLARGQAYSLFLTGNEAVLVLGRPLQASGHATPGAPQQSVVRLRLVGANPNSQIVGEAELPGKSNYFIGRNPANWHTNVPTYARVASKGLYPGVDVVYYGRQGQLENDFLVGPGADPGQVRLQIEGAEGVKLNATGTLVVQTTLGQVELRRPVAYQEIGSRRVPVGVHYAWRGKDEVGFDLAEYNHKEPLTIDPAVIYSTYIGGNGGDIAYGIAIDSNDDTYICGETNSSNFPTLNGKQTSYGGNGDAFVAELNSTLTALVYSTYLGGSQADSAAACAISSTDDIFVTGTTYSTDFPISPTISSTSTTSAFQTSYGGNGDAFVAEVSSTGSTLVYSSYLGGSGLDQGNGITVNSAGDAWVTGSTQSSNLSIPAGTTPYQTTLAGASDAFVAEVNVSGTQLMYLTYLGGTQADTAQAIKLGSSGNVYIAGYTFSTNFPTVNPIQSANAGSADAFVSELNPTLSGSAQLLFSTYLGGSGQDEALALALDSSGDIYVTGNTQSVASASTTGFPTAGFSSTTPPYQSTLNGTQNAFVAKLSPGSSTTASKEIYGTYLGGSGSDQGNGIAVDSSGDAWITGYTESSNFPPTNATQGLLGLTGGSQCGTVLCADVFVTELNPDGSGLMFSTYLGGSGADFGQAIALDSSGDAYITGSTLSSNFPTTVSDYQPALGGVAGNAFVTVITPASAPGLTVSPAKLNFGNETISVTSAAQPITVVNEGTKTLGITSITTTTDFAETDNCVGQISAGGGSCTINVTFTPPAAGSDTGQLTLTDNVTNAADTAGNSPQSITLTGTGVTSSSALTVAPTSLTFANQQVGTISAPQSVTITNTGSSTVDITQISVGTNFQETNTCLALNNVLAVGQSCSVSVTFTPTGSGALSGTLTVTDTATGSPQTVALGGTGTALFSLASSAPTVVTLIGDTTASFTVTASAVAGFTGTIALSCITAPSCTFSPAAIAAGQSSTLTLGDLSASTPNPYNFYVQGTSGSSTTTVPLTLLLESYSLSASPLLDTIVAGGSAGYTIVVTPLNGYNQELTLSCSSANFPSGARCTFTPDELIPNGKSPSTVSLSVVTTTQTSVWRFWSGHKPPPRWILIGGGIWLLLALGFLIKGDWLTQQCRTRRARVLVKLASQAFTFGVLVVLMFVFGSCRGIGPGEPTPSGTYFITVTGTMNANTAVTESTVVDLQVTPTS
jgi:hypothetical protein